MSVDALTALIHNSRKLLVFTGAGISTGSGIPDFRGPNGIWKRRQPVYYDEFLASEEKRIEYWEYKYEGYEGFRDAKPNACHQAIVELEESGRLLAVVTQNIDGLHQRAGSAEDLVIEVHGTNARTHCISCDDETDPAPAMEFFAEHRQTPRCQGCGGFLKLATISFGQALDERVLARAVGAAQQADAVLALGSTLSVHPAASIPLLAAKSGVPYAIVNRGETDHDGMCNVRIDGDVVEIVPEVITSALG